MAKVEPKNFNISESLPQVLLVGNGIANYGGCFKPWKKVIGSYAGSNYDSGLDNLPNPIQGTLYSLDNDSDQLKQYVKSFSSDYTYRRHQFLESLVKLKADAILTANYTYEIENTIKQDYAALKDKRRYAVSFANDSRFLMTTFNRMSSPEGLVRDIWHIHGEIRRPSSIVFTLDEYAREIGRIIEYNKDRGDDYLKHSDSVSFKSWFDYMILADVYILGLGMDTSETDLWWLLNRRKREKAHKGKVFFFEPFDITKEDVYLALKKLDVNVSNLGYGKTHNSKIDKSMYDAFYQSALDKTGELISARGGVAK